MRAFLQSDPPARALVLAAAITLDGANPRFFPDDPLWTDDDTLLDASKVVPRKTPTSTTSSSTSSAAPAKRKTRGR